MKLLNGLLSRYKNIKAPKRALRDAFISAVFQEIGVEIEKKQVNIQGKNVRLDAPSVVKNEIRLHQQSILKKVGAEVGNKNALMAIF